MFDGHGVRPVITICTICHFVWSALLLLSPSPLNITSLGGPVTGFLGQYGNAILYFSASCLSLFHPYFYSKKFFLGFLASLPQQSLINMAAFSALTAVLNSSYADGVMRPWEFILSDQIFIVMLAPAHIFDALRK